MSDSGLLGFAGREMQLAAMMPDGATLRDHLMSDWRQRGYSEADIPELLVPVEVAQELKYLWVMFAQLNSRRTTNGMSVNPISHSDFEAWERREVIRPTGIPLTSFEVKTLNMLEQVFLKASQPKDKPKSRG